ncbi:MAG: diaminopimelate decarboxylase [Candidatus Paceibacterota bacterium]
MQTPRYEYNRSRLNERLEELKSLSTPFGLTVRYALKANPHPEIISLVSGAGISFDASSSYEAAELLAQGIPGDRISLSSQQSAHNLPELLSGGVLYIAASLNQLRQFLAVSGKPPTVGLRVNPDMGYGHNNRTSTGGPNSSFGIWHEYLPEALELAKASGVIVDRLHIHVGSGADPSVWGKVMERALTIVELMPDVLSLNIGGGYKVHRYGDEKESSLTDIVAEFSRHLISFNERTGRKIHLELEPGTYLIAHAGTLVASVDDIIDTGSAGYTFLKLNTGMNDFLRSTLYGAQHEIEVVNDETETADYVVVGHNCESGDLLTPVNGNPEEIEPRTLKKAHIGDEVRIKDAGAYCASMRAKGYNSFPEAVEIFVD